MDNPNLLHCIILSRTALPLSSSLPPFLPRSFSPSSPFLLFPFFPFISLLLPPPLLLFFFFLLSLPPFFSLPPSLSIFPSISLSPFFSPFPPSHIFPSSISSLFFLLQAFSLNPMLHDTSYSSILLFLSILSSLYLPLLLFLHPSPLSLPLYAFLLH